MVVFEATKLPLRTWLLATYLLTAANMAALELKRHLGVDYDQRKSPRDKAAWRIKHKLMQAMAEHEAPRQLSGFVQIDDAYLGGERNGGEPGRGSENKQAFVIVVQTDAALEHPTYAVIEPARSFDNTSIKDWQARHLAPDAEVYSDGLFCFRRFVDAGHAHTVLETGGGRAACEVKGARWVNVLLGNVKRAISGSYDQRKSPRDHAIRQGKYARMYLAEAAYRFNRRFDLRAILPRLARAMMLCKFHPEPVLRMASNFHG